MLSLAIQKGELVTLFSSAKSQNNFFLELLEKAFTRNYFHPILFTYLYLTLPYTGYVTGRVSDVFNIA